MEVRPSKGDGSIVSSPPLHCREGEEDEVEREPDDQRLKPRYQLLGVDSLQVKVCLSPLHEMRVFKHEIRATGEE